MSSSTAADSFSTSSSSAEAVCDRICGLRLGESRPLFCAPHSHTPELSSAQCCTGEPGGRLLEDGVRLLGDGVCLGEHGIDPPSGERECSLPPPNMNCDSSESSISQAFSTICTSRFGPRFGLRGLGLRLGLGPRRDWRHCCSDSYPRGFAGLCWSMLPRVASPKRPKYIDARGSDQALRSASSGHHLRESVQNYMHGGEAAVQR